CKSGVARKSQPWNRVPGMERLGGGSGVPRLRTSCGGQARGRAGEVPLKYLAIFLRGGRRARAASAISARRAVSDPPVRRGQRGLTRLAIRPRRRQPLAGRAER